MSMWDTFTTIRSGMSVGSASMPTSRVDWSSTPPSFTPGASSAPSSSIVTSAWIFSSRRTSRKSTWTHLVADRVVLAVLEDRRHGLLAADLHVEQGGAVHEQVAQLARADLQRDGVGVAGAVEHGGHEAGAPQPPGLAGPALGALFDCEGWTVAVCHAVGECRESMAMTEGERWTREQLELLLSRRFSPPAVAHFLAESQRRANAVRAERPELARQELRWALAGAGACLALPPRRRMLAWWALTCLMLDWHLGMLETEDGRPRPLGAADALTLARAGLAPAVLETPARSCRAAASPPTRSTASRPARSASPPGPGATSRGSPISASPPPCSRTIAWS